MKIKEKNSLFICQVTENTLKVIRYLAGNRITGLEAEAIASDIDHKKLTEKLLQMLKKLGYRHNPVIISLARSKVTCRYLRVPTQAPEEIEKIISLQASMYLPYPTQELISAYQIISTDKEGYAQVNVVIAHKEVITHYVEIFKELKATEISIVLSSYGLLNLFNHLTPQESGPVMLIDIDDRQSELVIVSERKLLFSRYFKIDSSGAKWENLFSEEIHKTQDAYLKETAKKAPTKIMLTGVTKTCLSFAEFLRKQGALPVEILTWDNFNLPKDLLDRVSSADSSFASVIGLALRTSEENLNLLPQELKEKKRASGRYRQQLRLALVALGIILILFLGLLKNLANKAQYLKQLKLELDKVSQDARLLEEMEKRLLFSQQRHQTELSGVDLIYHLHQVMPAQISLVSLSYSEGNQITLRGQTPELNTLSLFAAQLKKTAAFQGFEIKIRYATQKKTPSGEVMDFEVTCAKK